MSNQISFVGWNDNNMFEAMLEGQLTPFWLPEEINSEVEENASELGAEMEMTYYEDGYGRMVLTEVKFQNTGMQL